MQTSYTGVSAFSSDPAPSDGALAAASAIGQALRANNHQPRNLNLPPTQIKRSDSMRGIAPAQPPATLRGSRAGSLRSNTSQRRIQSYKSAPSLNSRRSVSDMSSLRSRQAIPKTIKRYVPGANGLVAIDVPNPNHPDNKETTPRTIRRSTSLTASPRTGRQSSLSNLQSPSLSGKRSITRTESKILPNGTRVETTTTEVYVPENDIYDNFDSSEIHDLNQIQEEEPADDFTGLEQDRVNEESIKKMIHENEEIEKIERERAFSSVAEPIEDTIVIHNNQEPTVDDAKILNDDMQDELYTPEERCLAEEKLNELVELKEREILNDMIAKNQLEMSRDLDDSIKTENSFELNDESAHLDAPPPVTLPVSQSDDVSDSIVSDEVKPLSSHSSADAQAPFKSMAQHMRSTIQQSSLPKPEEEMTVPNRSPETQAQIDRIEEMTPTKSKNVSDLDPSKIPQRATGSQGLTKRKSVLKNKSDVKNYNINADVSYSSQATLQNTRLNAMASSSTLNLAKSANGQVARRQSINGPVELTKSNSVSAASLAANRHSLQPGAVGVQKQQQLPNPKVEEAKRRILAGSPAQKKAKELYRMSKARPAVTETYLQELANDDPMVRKSSFEKVRSESDAKASKRMTLRDEVDLSQQQQQQPQHFIPEHQGQTVSSANRTSRSNFKSRFSNDSDSDYDIPIVSKAPAQRHNTHTQLQPVMQNPTEPVSTAKPANDAAKTPRKKSESKFQKFFTEPADKRYVSKSSHMTTKTTENAEKPEKKGGFRKLKKLFGSKK